MPDFVRARCRLIPDFWKVAAVCLAMLVLFAGMAITQPPHGGEGWFSLATLFALFGATPFYWLIARRRGCIEFDENGARWRTAFGVGKGARWDEIESCDARMNSTGGKVKHWKFVVHTRKGAFSWTNSFENADELASFAARFCSLIPADSEAWPRRFGYGGGESILLPPGCLFLGAIFVGAIAKWLINADRSYLAAQLAIYVELYGWLLTIAGFAVFGVLVVGLPLLFLLFFFDISLQGWRFRNESFLATSDGLSWRVSERERLFAAWDELQTLHVEARGRLVSLPFWRLQSARGEFNWNDSLCGAAQLSHTCFARAPQLKSEVQARLREELGEAPDESDEVLTFDFKTRSGRAVLYGGALFTALTWGIVIFGPIQPPNGDAPTPTWLVFIVAIIVTAATLYGAQLFRRGCIALDARGIEWKLPLRARFVAWEEISDLIAGRKYYLQIGTRRVPLAVWDIYPTRLGLLLETIAQRAINAGGAWKAVGKPARATTDE